LEEDQELLARGYPWYNGAATGKTICLSDVTISGFAMDATGIRDTGSNAIESTRYYSVDGRQLASLTAGTTIVCQQMADGTCIPKKVLR